jgi:ribosomal protein L37E
MVEQSRARAKADGLKTYTPSRPCQRCGTRLRHTEKGDCVECTIRRDREHRHVGEPPVKRSRRPCPRRLDDARSSAIDLAGTTLAATSGEDPHQETPIVTAAMTAAGDEIYLSLNGQRIAKCEVQTETWTTLVPGWHVFVLDAVLVIEHDDGRRFVSQMESETLH